MDRDTAFMDSWWRITGAMGIVFFVLFFIGIFAAGDAPSFDDDINDIRTFFTEDANKYLVGNVLTSIAAIVFLIPFAVGLRGVLGAGDRSGGMWARTSLAGALIFVAISGGASAFGGALALSDAAGLDDSTLRFALSLDAVGFTTGGLGLALMMGAAAIVIARSGVLWRWLAILAGISALLIVIGTCWPVEGDGEGVFRGLGLLGSIAGALFVLISSIQLVIMKAPPTPTVERN